jgi:hypothetical protein
MNCASTPSTTARSCAAFSSPSVRPARDIPEWQSNDEIDAFTPQVRDFNLRRLDDIKHPQPSGDMGFVPLCNLHRRETHHANSQPNGRFAVIDEEALDHDRRREPRPAIHPLDVAADHWKARRPVGAVENVEAIIKVVVPKRGARIVQHVHRRDDWMSRGQILGHRQGGVVAERRALKNVAVVEEETIARFPAGLSDQRRGSCQTNGRIRPITKIVVGVKISMQVRHAEQAQTETPLGARESGVHIVLEPAWRQA